MFILNVLFYLFLNSFTISNDLVKIIALSNNMHIIKMKIEKANKLLGEAPTWTQAIARKHPEMPTSKIVLVEIRRDPDS